MEIVYKCACGRKTTYGPKCIFCSVGYDEDLDREEFEKQDDEEYGIIKNRKEEVEKQ